MRRGGKRQGERGGRLTLAVCPFLGDGLQLLFDLELFDRRVLAAHTGFHFD